MSFNGRAGLNLIKLEGRLSRTRTLTVGSYQLTVEATDFRRYTLPRADSDLQVAKHQRACVPIAARSGTAAPGRGILQRRSDHRCYDWLDDGLR